MKSSSYYSRKAEASRELGRWTHADEWATKAKKARAIEKKRRAALAQAKEGRP
jgi:hypothetical protein